jgi:uncharacterized membrane protein
MPLQRIKYILHRKRYFSFISLISALLLTVILSLFHISGKSLWFDESYSVFIAQKSLQYMLHIFWNFDGNAWLYYVVLRIWMTLGTSEFVVRSLSVLFAILTIPVVFFLAKNNFNAKIADISVLLLSLNTFFIAYAQETRGYTLLIFLTTLSLYFFIVSIEQGKTRQWIGYVIVTTFSLYVHLFTLLVIFSQVLALIFLKTGKLFSKKSFLSFSSLLLCALPLFIAPALRGGQLNALEQITIKDIGAIFLALSGGFLLQLIMYFFITGFGMVYIYQNKQFKNTSFWKTGVVIFSFLFPILFTFLFSIIIKPIYTARYLLISLVPFILFSSISLDEIRKINKKVFAISLLLLILFSYISFYSYYSDKKYAFGFWSISKGTEDWKGAAAFAVSKSQPHDGVILYAYHIEIPFEYYLNKNTNPQGVRNLNILNISSGFYYPGGGTFLPDPNITLLNSLHIKYKRIWLIISHASFSKLGRPTQVKIIQKNLSIFYTLQEKKTFPGDITIYLYEKK